MRLAFGHLVSQIMRLADVEIQVNGHTLRLIGE